MAPSVRGCHCRVSLADSTRFQERLKSALGVPTVTPTKKKLGAKSSSASSDSSSDSVKRTSDGEKKTAGEAKKGDDKKGDDKKGEKKPNDQKKD